MLGKDRASLLRRMDRCCSYGRYTARVDALHPALYHMQDKELIPSARSLGLALHVWTVDDEEYMEALVRQAIEFGRFQSHAGGGGRARRSGT